MNNQEKYHYPTQGVSEDETIEPCNVYGSGVTIGSVTCKKHCKFNQQHSDDEGWIICGKLADARKNN